jgi:hypothetical protein
MVEVDGDMLAVIEESEDGKTFKGLLRDRARICELPEEAWHDRLQQKYLDALDPALAREFEVARIQPSMPEPNTPSSLPSAAVPPSLGAS